MNGVCLFCFFRHQIAVFCDTNDCDYIAGNRKKEHGFMYFFYSSSLAICHRMYISYVSVRVCRMNRYEYDA